jgi:hypothetical protein
MVVNMNRVFFALILGLLLAIGFHQPNEDIPITDESVETSE